MARVNRKKDGKCKGYVITVELPDGKPIWLPIVRENYAEHVLRGLVHSGYSVSIREQIIDYPDALRELDEFQRYSDEYGDGDGEHTHSVGATLNLTEIDEIGPAPVPSVFPTAVQGGIWSDSER